MQSDIVKIKENFFKKNIKVFFSLFILLIINSLLFSYAKGGIYEEIKSNTVTNRLFDSASLNKNINAINHFYENEDSKIKSIDIKFKAKFYLPNNYDNLFQTAPFNEGIRAEYIHSNNSVWLDIGHSELYDNLLGFLIINDLKLNEYYLIHINIDIHRTLKIYLNNKLTLSAKLSKTEYKISDIAVGEGFDKTRPFHGEIKDFSMKYTFYKYKEHVEMKILFFSLVTFFLNIIIIFAIISKIGSNK